MKNKSLVITSISSDTNATLNKYANTLPSNFNFIVIGDTKSPEHFHIENCNYYSIKDQEDTGLALSEKLPLKGYYRKNIGYLIAIRDGAEEIYETDDDNAPYDNFFDQKNFNAESYLDKSNCVNIYSYFTKSNIWPRGFPITLLHDSTSKDFTNQVHAQISTPIIQGLADMDPDVDAIYRLIYNDTTTFDKNKSITLFNTFSPFNSQNTIWQKKAFPLLYIPTHCAFRECDIFRGYIALRVGFEFGWGIQFISPTVFQERNEHNLLDDFKDEINIYLHILDMINGLKALKLHKSEDMIYENLIICYKFMIQQCYIEESELELLTLWIEDCKRLLN